MALWARGMVGIGLLLLGLGILPMLGVLLLFPNADPLIPFMLSVSVAPLGALFLATGLILALLALLRR